MSTTPRTIAEAADILARLSIPELEQRLHELRIEDRTICSLLRTLRVRDAAERRRTRRTGGPA